MFIGIKTALHLYKNIRQVAWERTPGGEGCRKGRGFNWLGAVGACSRGPRQAAEASASGAWELQGAPQGLRGERQEVAVGGPQELADAPQEQLGGHLGVEDGPLGAVGGFRGLVGARLEQADAPLEPGGELQELVGAPLGPEGGPQQLEEGGPREPGGEPLQQEVGEPLGLEGGPLGQVDGHQELVGAPQMWGGELPELEGAPRVLGGAAGEDPVVLTGRAHWVAWGAEAGPRGAAGAETPAVGAVVGGHSSGAVVGASRPGVPRAGWGAPAASPS